MNTHDDLGLADVFAKYGQGSEREAAIGLVCVARDMAKEAAGIFCRGIPDVVMRRADEVQVARIGVAFAEGYVAASLAVMATNLWVSAWIGKVRE